MASFCPTLLTCVLQHHLTIAVLAHLARTFANLLSHLASLMSDLSPAAVIVTGMQQKLCLLERQVQMGMDKQALLDHQTIIAIGQIQSRPPLTDADATLLSEAVIGGPWSSANKVAIGNAILESCNNENGGSKKTRRGMQSCNHLHLYLTDQDWHVLTNPEWGEAVRVQTVAMRMHLVGISCPSEDMYKIGAALALRATYPMDHPVFNSAVLKQKAATQIKDIVRAFDQNMKSWPHSHITNYPASPQQLPEHIFKYIYKTDGPAAQQPETLISDYQVLLPKMVYRDSHLELKRERGKTDSRQAAGSASSSSPELDDAIRRLSAAAASLQTHAPGGGPRPEWCGHAVPEVPAQTLGGHWAKAPPPQAPEVHGAHFPTNAFLPLPPPPKAHVAPGGLHVPHGGALAPGGVPAKFAPGVAPPKNYMTPSVLQDGPPPDGVSEGGPDDVGDVGDAAAALDKLVAESAGVIAEAGAKVDGAIGLGRGGGRGRGRGRGRRAARAKATVKAAAKAKALSCKPAACPKPRGKPDGEPGLLGFMPCRVSIPNSPPWRARPW